MLNRKSMIAACGAVLGLTMAVASANAWGNGSQTTCLTFSGPVRLPGVTLGAGTYMFERTGSALDIVRVTNQQRSVVYFNGLTQQVARPSDLPADRFISLGESARGTAPPILAWYPDDRSNGQRFLSAGSR